MYLFYLSYKEKIFKKLLRKYLIIITAENKEKYISKTIESCLNQKLSNNIRIIVVYSKLKNEKTLKRKFKNRKILFLNYLKKKNIPMHDQLFKIEHANKLAKNEWVLLLDGDDMFTKDKIEFLNKLKLDSKKTYLNNHQIINGKFLNKVPKRKKYKKLYFYKKLFNSWPEKINTSSIIIHSNLLKKFYKKSKPYNWKYLAVDIQLALISHYKKSLIFIDKILTLKRENINNIDKTYSNHLKRIYWLRRYEQHNLTKKISNQSNPVDRLITLIFMKILK